jgi:hypothetical protein
LASYAGVALAQHADVRPRVSDGMIFTDGFIDATSETIPDLRIFGYDFQEDPADPYFAADPGFNAAAGSGLPGGSQLLFNILSGADFDLPANLSFWDGTDKNAAEPGVQVQFGLVPGGETLRLGFASGSVVVGTGLGEMSGFAIQTVNANGAVHRHLSSFLDAGSAAVPAEGVYLFPLELTSSDAAVRDSDPLFFVYNNGRSEEQHDLAIEGVEANLLVVESAWNVDANGNWSLAANWSAGVPHVAGAIASFGSIITQPRTATIDAPVSVGRLDFDNANVYTIAGASPLTLDVRNGDAQINVTSGSHAITAPLTLADNTLITVTPASNNLSLAALSATAGNLTKSGGGTLTVNNVRAAGLLINSGTVAVAPNGTNSGTSVVGSLSIAGGATPTAKFDLANNAAIVNHTGASPADVIRQQILAGRGGAGLGHTWSGLGISSSAAATAVEAESLSVGYAENSALPLGAYTSFRGQSVDATSVLMALTRTGDANLDGIVNDDDVTIVGASYAPGVPQAFWALGDFDYNGFVDDDDVTLLGVFYDPTAAPLASGGAVSGEGVAAVPEPASVILLGIMVMTIAALAAARGELRRIVRHLLRARRLSASTTLILASNLCFPTRFPLHREVSP